MAHPTTQQLPELPDRMSWEELAKLPSEIAGQIELWDGYVVWVRRGPPEHQQCTEMFSAAMRRNAQRDATHHPEHCWRAALETNVFLQRGSKDDYLTPDFLIYRCLEKAYDYVHFDDALLVGEVLSPSNTERDIEAKKARYADAGIPWYWEVTLSREPRGIASVRAFALQTRAGELPPGVAPLHKANYLAVGEWTPHRDPDGMRIEFPFAIHIPWSEVEF